MSEPNDPITGEVIEPSDATPEEDAEWVREAFDQVVEGFIETGRRLLVVKARSKHGHWGSVLRQLGLEERKAQRLMRIYRYKPIGQNPAILPVLPRSWTVLFGLTQLPVSTFDHGIATGLIRPDMSEKDVVDLRMWAERTGADRPVAGAPGDDATYDLEPDEDGDAELTDEEDRILRLARDIRRRRGGTLGEKQGREPRPRRGKGAAPEPAPAPFAGPDRELALKLKEWLIDGRRMVATFKSGQVAALRCKENGVQIDPDRVDVVIEFLGVLFTTLTAEEQADLAA